MKLLTLLAALVITASSASAAITEIRKDFPHQTALLSPTAIMAAPNTTGTYLLSVYFDESAACNCTVKLSWIDENNGLEQKSFPDAPYNYWVGQIRLAPHTAPTVETDGEGGSYEYSIYIVGFGFWRKGIQAQGGLSEPFSYTALGQNNAISTALFTPSTEGTYLVSIVLQQPPFSGTGFTVSWVGENGPESVTGGNVFPIHAVANQPVVLSTFYRVTAVSYDLYANAVRFGLPSAGSGPLADSEYNLGGWTNATYPHLRTVLNSAVGGPFLLAVSALCFWPNSAQYGEAAEIFWVDGNGRDLTSGIDMSSNSSSSVSSGFLDPNGSIQFYTYNTVGQRWGSSPTYDLEVDAIQF